MSTFVLIMAMLASFCGGVVFDRYPWLNHMIDEVEEQQHNEEHTVVGHPGSCKWCQRTQQLPERIDTLGCDLIYTTTNAWKSDVSVYIPTD